MLAHTTKRTGTVKVCNAYLAFLMVYAILTTAGTNAPPLHAHAHAICFAANFKSVAKLMTEYCRFSAPYGPIKKIQEEFGSMQDSVGLLLTSITDTIMRGCNMETVQMQGFLNLMDKPNHQFIPIHEAEVESPFTSLLFGACKTYPFYQGFTERAPRIFFKSLSCWI